MSTKLPMLTSPKMPHAVNYNCIHTGMTPTDTFRFLSYGILESTFQEPWYMDGANVLVIHVTRLLVKSGTVQILLTLTMQHSLSFNLRKLYAEICMTIQRTFV